MPISTSMARRRCCRRRVGRPAAASGAGGGERRRLLGALLLAASRRTSSVAASVLGRRRERGSSSGYTCGIERYAAVASGSDPATPPGSDATSDEAGGGGGGGALPYTASGRRRRRCRQRRGRRWRGWRAVPCTVAAETPLSFIMRVNSSPAIVFCWCTCPSAVAGRTRSPASHGDAALRQHASTSANGRLPPAPVHGNHRRRERDAVRDVRRVGSRRAHEHEDARPVELFEPSSCRAATGTASP